VTGAVRFPDSWSWYQARARRYDRRHPGIPGDAAFYAGLAHDRRVLEIGAGTGRVTAALATTARVLIALDHVPAMLEIAARRLRPSAPSPGPSLLLADARALPLRGPFDLAVLAYRTLQHVSDGERTGLLRSLYDVLRPDGILAFDTWHGPAPVGRAARPALVAVAEGTIAADLIRAGFGIVRVDGGFSGEPAEPSSFVRVWQAVSGAHDRAVTD
jgi:SAM-dependent methyltransferase